MNHLLISRSNLQANETDYAAVSAFLFTLNQIDSLSISKFDISER